MGEVTRSDAAAMLGRFSHRALSVSSGGARSLRPAAVALVLVGEASSVTGGAPHRASSVLLTKRPRHLKRHAGQFALPGGRLEPGEDAPEAARRELREELGLALPASAQIGRLDDVGTRSGFRMTPIVFWGADRVGPGDEGLRPDPGEVERVFRVPLADLDREASYRRERIPESPKPVFSMHLPTAGTRVFAPTAAVLFQLREVLLRGRATRVDDLEQPPFAWR